MAETRKHDLTAGPVAAQLRRQGTPFALGLVAIFSFDAADLFFISRLGDDPLAAVSFALPLIWLVYGIGIGFEAGAASCVSRAVGREDQAQARRLTTDTITLAVACATVLAVIGLNSIDSVFSLLGATPDLLPLIHDYMGTWYWVAPLDMALVDRTCLDPGARQYTAGEQGHHLCRRSQPGARPGADFWPAGCTGDGCPGRRTGDGTGDILRAAVHLRLPAPEAQGIRQPAGAVKNPAGILAPYAAYRNSRR